MAQYQFDIAAGADDYDTSSSVAATMIAASVGAAQTSFAYCRFDTSSLSGIDIGSATLYVYTDSHTKSAGTTYDRAIEIKTPTSYYQFMADAVGGTGWTPAVLDETAIGHISKTGNTLFRMSVGVPGGAYVRNWALRTYEYGTAYDAYLEIVAGGTVDLIRIW